MRRTTTALVIVVVAGIHGARADFVLLGERGAPGPSAPRPAARQSDGPIASGFGRHVPLSFAVRQIVPSNLHVTYANGIDSSTTVDWTGGQAWNAVLTRAVAPLGLHVQVSPPTVTISR